MKRYELVEGGSSKFWEVGAEGKKLLVRFGRIGTKGQTQEKTFDTDAKATAERDKLTREKTKKGYKEIPTASSGDQHASTANDEQTALLSPQSMNPQQARPFWDLRPRRSRRPTVKPNRSPQRRKKRGWLDAGNGYTLALEAGKIKCKNAKAQILSSVPKELKEGDAFEQLDNLREFLASHERECVELVESWMLRSLPTPRAVLVAVWPDPAWRRALENAVVVPDGDPGRGRFFPCGRHSARHRHRRP